MKITIECNKEQANLMVAALEEYFRIRMGQTNYLADKLAFDGFNYKCRAEGEFEQIISNREELENILAKIKNFLPATHSSDSCRSASDIWSCLRHEMYIHGGGSHSNISDVRACEPIQLGIYELPKITIE